MPNVGKQTKVRDLGEGKGGILAASYYTNMAGDGLMRRENITNHLTHGSAVKEQQGLV
jgi:hypothetical protein